MKRVIVLLADGFEECEALLVVDILRRARIDVCMASVSGNTYVESSRNITVRADMLASEADFDSFDMVFLPGGRIGTENLQGCELVKEQSIQFAKQKMIASICAAPSILAFLGLLDGRKATCHPDYRKMMGNVAVLDKPVIVDENIVTGQGLGATFEFAFALVDLLAGPDETARIKNAICYRDRICGEG